jgi:tetratricopeptide (TPR) repeat protein
VLQVITKTDINTTLEQSGYSTTEALTANDAKALANLIHADEFIDAHVFKTASGFKVESHLVLARDNAISEPLVTVEGARLGDVADKVAKEVREARRQLDDESECYLAARQSKYPDAIKLAKEGIKRFPKANMMRLCLLGTMQSLKWPIDSQLPVAEAILKVDSLSRPALTAASAGYKEKADSTKYIKTLLTLVAIDPSNTKLVNQVVNDLGAYKKVSLAAPIIKQAVGENPGDANLLSTAWKVALAAGEWKDAIGYGDELVKIDTSAADSSYYFRLATAYGNDSQPAKVAETYAKGAAKFPDNASMWLLLGGAQRKAGQTQQAIGSFRKALAVNPKTEGAHLLIAQSYVEIQQPDSALAEIRVALAGGDDKARLGGYSLSLANNAYKAANVSKTRDDWAKALRLSQFADSVNAAPAAKFLTGASAVQLAIASMQEAQPAKSCELATLSKDNFSLAEIVLPAGGAFNKEAAGQLMGFVAQYGPIAGKMTEQYCKGAPGAKTPPKKPGR